MDNKNVLLENQNWSLALNLYSESEEVLIKEFDKVISTFNEYRAKNLLIIDIKNKNLKDSKKYLINNIGGGIYLHTKNEIDKSSSVILLDNILYLSLNDIFLAIQLEQFEILWQIIPDRAYIFEFYELENDFLLRGELEIHRIDKQGNILWSYGGCDIWVNIEGLPEVTILSDSIKLIDFEGNEYQIDYNGNTLNFIPLKQTVVKKW